MESSDAEKQRECLEKFQDGKYEQPDTEEGAHRVSDVVSSPTQFTVLYWSTYAGAALLSPYLALFLDSRSRNKVEIGFLLMIPRVFSTLVAPVWAVFSDRYHLAREIVIINNVLTTVHTVLLLLIEPDTSLFLVVLLFGMRALWNSPCGSLFDGIAAKRLDDAGWGIARGHGALSFAVFSFLGGLLLDLDSSDGYSLLFTGFVFIQVFNVSLLFKYLPSQKKVPNPDGGSSMFSNLGKIQLMFLENRDCCKNFATVVLLSGVGFGVIESFLFLFLATELGASGLLLGLARLVMTLVEVPVFWYIESVLDKITQLLRLQTSDTKKKQIAVWIMLLMTQAAFFVRFVWYSVLTNAWWVFPAEMLHGLTFGVMWKLSVRYAKDLAKTHVPQAEGTMQTLLSGLHFGVAAAAGSVIGGLVFSYFGLRVMFKCCALLALLSVCLASKTCASLYRDAQSEGAEQDATALSFSSHALIHELDAAVTSPVHPQRPPETPSDGTH